MVKGSPMSLSWLFSCLHTKSWNFLSFARCAQGWYFSSDLSGFLCFPTACYSYIIFLGLPLPYLTNFSFPRTVTSRTFLCLMFLCRLCPRSLIILSAYYTNNNESLNYMLFLLHWGNFSVFKTYFHFIVFNWWLHFCHCYLTSVNLTSQVSCQCCPLQGG